MYDFFSHNLFGTECYVTYRLKKDNVIEAKT